MMPSTVNSTRHTALNRRDLLKAGLLSLLAPLPLPLAPIAATPRYRESVIFNHDLPPIRLDNWAVRVVALEFPAGGLPTLAHRHPGFVLGYVLEGEVWFQLQDQPKQRLSAGQVFYEPPGEIHVTTYSASEIHPAKAIALVFGESGQPLTLPAQV